ncbi:MAG: hypothetical protein AAB886_01400 [Patescibacteria group bacterium]
MMRSNEMLAPIDAELSAISESELVRKYKPKFLGMGSEHIVFELEGRPNLVLKVSKRDVRDSLIYNRRNGLAPDSKSEHTTGWMARAVESERDEYALLRNYFGEDMLQEAITTMPVPVTADMLKLSSGTHDPVPDEIMKWFGSGTRDINTIVRVQKKAKREMLVEGGAAPILSAYFELNREACPDDKYVEVFGALIDGNGEFERENIPFIFGARAVRELSGNIDDEDFLQMLRTFAEKAQLYTEISGRTFDLAGINNANAYKDEKTGRWRMTLLDIRNPAIHTKDFERAKRLLYDFASRRREFTDYEAILLMNVLGYLRVVNAIADLTGAGVNLRLSQDRLAHLALDIRNAIIHALAGSEQAPDEKRGDDERTIPIARAASDK